MSVAPPLRTIKSFVVRQGRMTPGQKAAFERLAALYCIDLAMIPQSLRDSSLDPKELFSPPLDQGGLGGSKIVLEIGFGMGDALLYYAKQNPDTLYLGIEVHPPGIGRVLNEIEKQNLQNIRLLQGDAIEILKQFPDQSLARVNLFFPDPWPKARHHKRRIVNADFASLVAQKLQAEGIFHMATDWENYAEWMTEVMSTHPKFKQIGTERGDRPLTKFEQRGLNLGHKIYDFIFQKI